MTKGGDPEKRGFARRVASSVLVSAIGNAIGKGTAAIALFVMLGFMSSEELGTGQLVLSFLVIARAFTEASLGVALVQVRDATRDQIDSLFWLSLGITTGAYLLIAGAIAPLLAAAYPDFPDLASLVRVASLSFILFSLFFVSRSLMERDLQFGRLVATENGSLVVGSVVGIWLASSGYGAWSFVWMELAARGTQAVSTVAARFYRPRLHYSFAEIRGMFRFSLYASGSRILYNLYTYADYFVVARVFGKAATGIYTFAYRVVADPVKQLAMAINQVAYPAFARLQDDPQRLRRYFFAIARVSLSLIGSVLAVVVLFLPATLDALSNSALDEYGQYRAALPLVWTFAAVGLIQAVAPLIPQLLNAVGLSRLNFLYSLTCAVVLPVGFVIGAKYGLAGVATAWAIGYPLVVLVLLYFGAQAMGLPAWHMAKTFLGLVVVIPTFAVGYVLEHMLSGAGLSPAAVAAVGGTTTLVLALALTYVRERKALRALRA